VERIKGCAACTNGWRERSGTGLIRPYIKEAKHDRISIQSLETVQTTLQLIQTSGLLHHETNTLKQKKPH